MTLFRLGTIAFVATIGELSMVVDDSKWMRYTINDLLLVPAIGTCAVYVILVAEFFGQLFLPELAFKLRPILSFCEQLGFGDDIVYGHLSGLLRQLSTIIMLSVVVGVMFVLRTRFCDQTAVISMGFLPIVGSVQIVASFGGDFSAVDLRDLATWILEEQSMTTVIALISSSFYLYLRTRMPNPKPSRIRVLVAAATLVSLFASSVLIAHCLT